MMVNEFFGCLVVNVIFGKGKFWKMKEQGAKNKEEDVRK
jgi:hypothetical protein